LEINLFLASEFNWIHLSIRRCLSGTASGRMAAPEADMTKVTRIATPVEVGGTDASNIQAAEIFVDGGATGSPSGAPICRGWTRVLAKIVNPVSVI
jgi:hypothetical protein